MTEAKGLIRRALLSVFQKDGLVDLARALREQDVEILASGGTARALEEADVPVIPVEVFTGAREVLGGRVKTLHPKIHAGILADRRDEGHLGQLADAGYAPIDLVVCNLYPFEEKLAAGTDHATLVETIDIGGPTLIRAAAKNADGGVTVVCDPKDYDQLVAAIAGGGAPDPALRRCLAARAFRHVATYDLAIAGWSESVAAELAKADLPESLPRFVRHAELRYGENPHQPAALFVEEGTSGGVGLGEQLAGKGLSYTNYLDLDGAYRSAFTRGDTHRCSVIKHTNPCGLAEHDDQSEAFCRALAGDPVSAFGGILGFNRPLENTTAVAIKESKLFVECIVAPGFDEAARKTLKKKKNLRLVKVPSGDPAPAFSAHRIGGALVVQKTDPGPADPVSWQCVTEKKLESGWLEELFFAMQATWLLKSNAIALTKDHAIVGIGTGQTSRVDATEQAIKKGGENVAGCFLASDAFFPFDDCVKLAAAAGIQAIAQPGGSKRDQDSIDACNALGLAMVFTGQRHFRH